MYTLASALSQSVSHIHTISHAHTRTCTHGRTRTPHPKTHHRFRGRHSVSALKWRLLLFAHISLPLSLSLIRSLFFSLSPILCESVSHLHSHSQSHSHTLVTAHFLFSHQYMWTNIYLCVCVCVSLFLSPCVCVCSMYMLWMINHCMVAKQSSSSCSWEARIIFLTFQSFYHEHYQHWTLIMEGGSSGMRFQGC